MKILIIGDSCIDIFQYGIVERICPEAPCPVFKPIYKTENEGMAGNVVANLKALDSSIEIEFITNKVKPVKKRMVEQRSNQMILREDMDDAIEEKFNIEYIQNKYFDCVVVVDYNKGFLSTSDLLNISKMFPLSFLDSKKRLEDWADGFTFIKINEAEYNNSKPYDDGNIIVTLSNRGAEYRGERFRSEEAQVIDVSGAGDTFLAGLVYEFLKTKDIRAAIDFANKCSGKVVKKRGVSTI